MNQLRITSCKPQFFGFTDTPYVVPTDLGELTNSGNLRYTKCYLDGKAEELAEYDIPIFLDGDMAQLEAENPDILLMLPSGSYQCVVTVREQFFSDSFYYSVDIKEDI